MSENSYRKTENETNINCGNSEAKPSVIWKIDRFATHDGPGIRTSVYFKGCPLRCKWCSNPEGQVHEPILVFVKEKCTGCGLCLEVCPPQALELQQATGAADNVNLRINRRRCNSCGVCTSACPTKALDIWGKCYSVPELLDILERDRVIHRRSGGGVTCTGGEPLYQGEFLQELLEVCHRHGIHTAVETSAYADAELFKAILQKVDWLFIDLKHINARAHQTFTGKSNALILDNTRLASSILLARNKVLVIRIAVIPGINDSQNIHSLAGFLGSLPFMSMVELLPYHCYGVYKYALLGRTYRLRDVKPPTAEVMESYKKVLKTQGIAVA